MPDNKNQHFVPRCYLRPFTDEGRRKSIDIFNLSAKRCFHGPLKSQCSKDYFYGKDQQLERAIKGTEDMYADALREILSPGYGLSPQHKIQLKLFWLFQYLRTEAAAKVSFEMMKQGFPTIGEAGEQLAKINLKDTVRNSMIMYRDHMEVVMDLKVVLVRSNAACTFITSDNPAILTNRWFKQRESGRGFDSDFGLVSAGNILLLPLSPNVLMCGYDGDAYSIEHKNGWTGACSKSSTRSFNEHQFINCSANVYFRGRKECAPVKTQFEKVSDRCFAKKHSITRMRKVGTHNGRSTFVRDDSLSQSSHTSQLVLMDHRHPAPLSWPSEIRYRSKAVCYSNGTGIGPVRAGALPFVRMESGATGFKKILFPSLTTAGQVQTGGSRKGKITVSDSVLHKKSPV